MEIIKKNILSIVCGVVALAAIGLSFYPLGSYKTGLLETLQKRVSVYHAVDSLRNKPRNKPVLDPDKTEAEPLGRFPNQEVIDLATKKKEEFEQQAKKIMDTAVAMNKHDVLVPNTLPAPTSSAYLIMFRDGYKDAVEKRIAAILKSTTLPTPEQIKAATDKLRAEKYNPSITGLGGSTGQQTLEQAFQQEALLVPAQEQRRVAAEHLCYMDPLTALPVNTKVTTAQVPLVTDVWYAQLSYWIYEDVAKAIAATNAGATNIMDAPVKHVTMIRLGSTVSPLPYILPPGTTGAIEGDANAAVPKTPDVSPTGRVCNPLYDVVAFEVQVNMDAEKIPWLLKELENKRFISVHSMNVTSVDSISQQNLGYFYGSKPVAQVTLECEEIMFRDWSHKLMPPAVAQNMGGGEGGAMTPGANPGGPGITPGGGPGINRNSRDLMY
jgi:hypothetical protein